MMTTSLALTCPFTHAPEAVLVDEPPEPPLPVSALLVVVPPEPPLPVVPVPPVEPPLPPVDVLVVGVPPAPPVLLAVEPALGEPALGCELLELEGSVDAPPEEVGSLVLLPPESPPLLEELVTTWPPLELLDPPSLPADDATELLPPAALEALLEWLPLLPPEPVDPVELVVSVEQAARPPLTSPDNSRTPRRPLCEDAMFPPWRRR
jgi:hypothetical protein